MAKIQGSRNFFLSGILILLTLICLIERINIFSFKMGHIELITFWYRKIIYIIILLPLYNFSSYWYKMNPPSCSPSHPSPTGSRVKIICHHCDKTFDRRNLNYHMKRMQPGRKPIDKMVECLSYFIYYSAK